ncbi:MAG TPA: hypothetical protein PLZ05_01795 [Alphaproteobacteria bacterium]|nr:hypothetical protein [Alphaproteobacteria bacterium]
MEDKPINLKNETDLTNFIASLFYKNIKPINERMIVVDSAGNFMPTPEFIGQSREIIRNFNNRDFLINNSSAVATYMAFSYLKLRIRLYLRKYVNTEFLTTVPYNENLSQDIKSLIKWGHAVYEIKVEKIPQKFKEELFALKDFLYNQAMDYIKQQSRNYDKDFVFDKTYLGIKFPYMDKAIKKQKIIQAKKKFLGFLYLKNIGLKNKYGDNRQFD